MGIVKESVFFGEGDPEALSLSGIGPACAGLSAVGPLGC